MIFISFFDTFWINGGKTAVTKPLSHPSYICIGRDMVICLSIHSCENINEYLLDHLLNDLQLQVLSPAEASAGER